MKHSVTGAISEASQACIGKRQLTKCSRLQHASRSSSLSASMLLHISYSWPSKLAMKPYADYAQGGQ